MAAELARVAVVPEDLVLHDSAVPGRFDLPHELADAALEATRATVTSWCRCWSASTGTRSHADCPAARRGHHHLWRAGRESRGRLRALVAEVDGEEASTVGVLAWTLVADGWRALRPHETDGRLHLEVARVIPEDLAAELAPVLAEARR